jgi:hypothetical protein
MRVVIDHGVLRGLRRAVGAPVIEPLDSIAQPARAGRRLGSLGRAEEEEVPLLPDWVRTIMAAEAWPFHIAGRRDRG